MDFIIFIVATSSGKDKVFQKFSIEVKLKAEFRVVEWKCRAMNLNVIHLVGRAGVDPEIKYFESGTVLCKFPIAVDRRSKKDDKPDWFELEMWGRTAEVASEYVRKGKQVGIQGKLKIDTWQDQNGNNRSRPVIRVDRLELLGSKGDNQGGSGMDYPDEF